MHNQNMSKNITDFVRADRRSELTIPTICMVGRSLAMGLALTLAWLAAVRAEETATHNASPIIKPGPLVGRAVLVAPMEQWRILLRRGSPLSRRPWLLTPRILRNPLVSDALKIEVENTSGQDVSIYSARGEAVHFWVDITVEDSAGKPVPFPHSGQSGIKRLSPLTPITPRSTTTLKPDQVVVQKDGIWRHLNIHNVPQPGQYTIRVACSYYRSPDGQDCRVEAAPLRITLTAEDIREWRALQDALERPLWFEIEEAKIELP